jgi:cell wall assembly regulator SMI1
MTDIYKQCNLILNEINLFSKEMVYLGPPIEDNRVEIFEKQIGFNLPSDFKYIIKIHNGISLAGTQFLGIDKELRGSSLEQVYKFEHFEVTNKMPVEFMPFSPDGAGNHYCLNLNKMKENLCPVVFWQSDLNYNNNEVEECNNTFIEWLKEVMIEWTLDDYNYDGTEKLG